jgi:hypothetical protein
MSPLLANQCHGRAQPEMSGQGRYIRSVDRIETGHRPATKPHRAMNLHRAAAPSRGEMGSTGESWFLHPNTYLDGFEVHLFEDGAFPIQDGRISSADRAPFTKRELLVQLTFDAPGSHQRAHPHEQIAGLMRSRQLHHPGTCVPTRWLQLSAGGDRMPSAGRRMSRWRVPGRRSGTACRVMVSSDDTNAGWCRL